MKPIMIFSSVFFKPVFLIGLRFTHGGSGVVPNTFHRSNKQGKIPYKVGGPKSDATIIELNSGEGIVAYIEGVDGSLEDGSFFKPAEMKLTAKYTNHTDVVGLTVKGFNTLQKTLIGAFYLKTKDRSTEPKSWLSWLRWSERINTNK